MPLQKDHAPVLTLGELQVSITPREVGEVRFGKGKLIEEVWLSMLTGKWEGLGPEEQAAVLAPLQVNTLDARVHVTSESTIGEGPQGKG